VTRARGGWWGFVRCRLGLRVLSAAIVSISLTTCGIETITIFNAPGFASPSQNQLTLTHDPSNNSASFSGYEIYYRAFDTQDAADLARTTIERAAALVTATPENCISLLASTGFTRMYDVLGEDGQGGIRPLFALTAGDQAISPPVHFDLILDFSSSANPPYANWFFTKSSAPNTQIQVTRSVSVPGATVSFETSYSSGADYTGAGSVSGQDIYFVFFAVAYGVDVSSTSFSNTYSLPASINQSLIYRIPPR
jgi:hypothetical protein